MTGNFHVRFLGEGACSNAASLPDSMNVTSRLSRIFPKPIQIKLVIFVGNKTDLAVIAALNDMHRKFG
jgi:hypothetical protein